jgi:hypothetical protein
MQEKCPCLMKGFIAPPQKKTLDRLDLGQQVGTSRDTPGISQTQHPEERWHLLTIPLNPVVLPVGTRGEAAVLVGPVPGQEDGGMAGNWQASAIDKGLPLTANREHKLPTVPAIPMDRRQGFLPGIDRRPHR